MTPISPLLIGSLVRKINEVERDMDWERRMIESLKAAKLYLKGDYKVCFKQTEKFDG